MLVSSDRSILDFLSLFSLLAEALGILLLVAAKPMKTTGLLVWKVHSPSTKRLDFPIMHF